MVRRTASGRTSPFSQPRRMTGITADSGPSANSRRAFSTIPVMRHPLLMASFDDLIGAGEDCERNIQPESLGGLEVDHQLEFRRLLHWQIGRLRAVEDFPSIDPGQTGGVPEARSITN